MILVPIQGAMELQGVHRQANRLAQLKKVSIILVLFTVVF